MGFLEARDGLHFLLIAGRGTLSPRTPSVSPNLCIIDVLWQARHASPLRFMCRRRGEASLTRAARLR